MEQSVLKQIEQEIFRNAKLINQTACFSIAQTPLRISELGYIINNPAVTEKSLQFFCTKGCGKFVINLQEYELSENEFICVLPHFLFQLMECSDDFEIQLIVFSFDFISGISFKKDIAEIMRKIEQHATVSLTGAAAREYLHLYNLILNQYQSTELYRDEVVRSLFTTMIYKLTGYYLKQLKEEHIITHSRQEKIYQLFLNQLFKDYKKHRTVSHYAEKLYLSPKYFSKVIVDMTGKTPIDWIQEITINASKALIKGSSLTIEQISEELNFPNRSFFGTFFKKHTGLTPYQYRNQ